VGGGIRDRAAIEKYCAAGAMRVILGTAAAGSPGFVREMAREYGGKIAVGVDIRDGFVAVKGWTELSEHRALDFCRLMEDAGIKTIISTDISKDGLLSGTNLELYNVLSEQLSIDIIASGGVSTIDEVRALRDIGLYGCILGKALYTGGIDLREAVRLCEEEK
ncbi:MAG: 1-(5-phosphoribosyl)-5-((5-phosphoribosylamino)methylideneamino)imidazole-4-carboxamide isomerase, partial [Clostridiales bacterium]|nr:1-(5-phosphoribosyl)-5-((5-phosphoribosylamino)methylideneamino)imidazole-4-carboxamide isomerase [Clostridiales bacterium]